MDAVSEMMLLLPHPPMVLRPNGRAHWATKARAVKKARQNAHLQVLGMLPRGERFTPRAYALEWFYRGACPDADNCLAACKAYLDGAADAFGVNDRTLECRGIMRVNDKRRAGQVCLRFFAGGEEVHHD